MGTETDRIHHVNAAGLAQSVITQIKCSFCYQTLRIKTLFAALHPLGLRLYRRKEPTNLLDFEKVWSRSQGKKQKDLFDQCGLLCFRSVNRSLGNF